MRLIQEILQRIVDLDGFDENKEYFDYSDEDRNKLTSILWDEIYRDVYLNSLIGRTIGGPLETQYDILSDLYYLQKHFEMDEQYELCDIVRNLINITEKKVQQIDRYYAHTKKKTDGNN